MSDASPSHGARAKAVEAEAARKLENKKVFSFRPDQGAEQKELVRLIKASKLKEAAFFRLLISTYKQRNFRPEPVAEQGFGTVGIRDHIPDFKHHDFGHIIETSPRLFIFARSLGFFAMMHNHGAQILARRDPTDIVFPIVLDGSGNFRFTPDTLMFLGEFFPRPYEWPSTFQSLDGQVWANVDAARGPVRILGVPIETTELPLLVGNDDAFIVPVRGPLRSAPTALVIRQATYSKSIFSCLCDDRDSLIEHARLHLNSFAKSYSPRVPSR